MSRNTLRTSLAALAMAIAAGVAVAPAAAAPDAPQAAGQHRGPMKHDGMWVPGLGPLTQAQVDTLNLDAKQKALFDTAREASRQSMQSRHEARPQHRALLQSQLAAGKLDPHALIAEGDKHREAMQLEHKALRQQWLAVWDSLNDTQRAAVSQMAKERMDSKQARHGDGGSGHHRRGGMHGQRS